MGCAPLVSSKEISSSGRVKDDHASFPEKHCRGSTGHSHPSFHHASDFGCGLFRGGEKPEEPGQFAEAGFAFSDKNGAPGHEERGFGCGICGISVRSGTHHHHKERNSSSIGSVEEALFGNSGEPPKQGAELGVHPSRQRHKGPGRGSGQFVPEDRDRRHHSLGPEQIH